MALNKNCGGGMKNVGKIAIHQDIRIVEALDTVFPPQWVLPEQPRPLGELPNLDGLSQVFGGSEPAPPMTPRYIEITDDEMEVGAPDANQAPRTPQPSTSGVRRVQHTITQQQVEDKDEDSDVEFDFDEPPPTPQITAVIPTAVRHPHADEDDDFEEQAPPMKMPKMLPISELKRVAAARHVRHGRGKNMLKLIMSSDDATHADSNEDSPHHIITEAKRKLKKLQVKNNSARAELVEEKSVMTRELERLRLEIDRIENKSSELDQKIKEIDISGRQVGSFLHAFESL